MAQVIQGDLDILYLLKDLRPYIWTQAVPGHHLHLVSCKKVIQQMAGVHEPCETRLIRFERDQQVNITALTLFPTHIRSKQADQVRSLRP
jgi:hypothetical protein